MDAPNEDTGHQLLPNNDDKNDWRHASRTASTVSNIQQNGDNLALSEEIRQMQKRLAEIDNRIQTTPEGLVRTNLIESIFKENEVSSMPPPTGPSLPYFSSSMMVEHSMLERARWNLSNLMVMHNEHINPVQRYLQIERARLEIKHRQEKLVVMMTEDTVESRQPLPGNMHHTREQTTRQPSISGATIEPIISHLSWDSFKYRPRNPQSNRS
ncbi:hypothetical protein F5B19DRAFT_498575 [Rostrohypoxylon terebratum]|nr:hypothetical protein F5B19DRAFT_498575 [Rostrohypoxylon terebratum]